VPEKGDLFQTKGGDEKKIPGGCGTRGAKNEEGKDIS